MKHWHVRLHAFTSPWHHMTSEALLAVFLTLFLLITPASAAMRFQERSLYVRNTEPGVTTSYTVAFRYMTPANVGSVEMLFCYDPIPYQPCVAPTNMDVANAVLASQSGESGFSIQSKTTNRILLTRTPAMLSAAGASSYTFDNIKNTTDQSQAFSVRLRSYGSTNGTGPMIDFGTVRSQVGKGIVLETQVPPMLIFCIAEEVYDNCVGTNENYYRDMGQLNDGTTLTAQSQMAVGTNATAGFAIAVNGNPPSAGTNVIDGAATPSASKPGTNQFGINLVENSAPAVGKNPEGTWANAVASPGYDSPNLYKYVPGDVVAFSPNVSLMKKFTVSYILNSSADLRPGVYTTTITYIASGRF